MNNQEIMTEILKKVKENPSSEEFGAFVLSNFDLMLKSESRLIKRTKEQLDSEKKILKDGLVSIAKFLDLDGNKEIEKLSFDEQRLHGLEEEESDVSGAYVIDQNGVKFKKVPAHPNWNSSLRSSIQSLIPAHEPKKMIPSSVKSVEVDGGNEEIDAEIEKGLKELAAKLGEVKSTDEDLDLFPKATQKTEDGEQK